ncbi:MAG TPA: sugar phosphate isomerase/epimerase family protein [Eubacteriales bacterium]|mgnify:CR=1 FL=1|nr:sugar phosphate isomerase/epimerase family protein [Eubacteriales bacterium]
MFAPRLCMTAVKQRGQGAPFLYGGNLVKGIAAAKEFGYDCVELHVRAPEELGLQPIRKALHETGLCVSALGTGRAYVDDRLSLIDLGTREQALKRLFGFVDAASVLGAQVIIGCLRGNIPAEEKDGESLLLLADAMRRADAYAAEHGVGLLLEAINRYENNYLCSVYDVADFIRDAELCATGILADMFHMNIEEADPVAAAYDNADLIHYVHAADSNRLYPGAGHADIAAILMALKQKGYAGDISAECLPVPNDETAAALWLENMKGYLARL